MQANATHGPARGLMITAKLYIRYIPRHCHSCHFGACCWTKAASHVCKTGSCQGRGNYATMHMQGFLHATLHLIKFIVRPALSYGAELSAQGQIHPTPVISVESGSMCSACDDM